MRFRLLYLGALVCGLLACSTPQIPAENHSQAHYDRANHSVGHTGSVPHYRARVIRVLPHDSSSFTQGFELADGTLYEGTGQYGESKLRATNPDTGKVLRQAVLPADFFGEGITVMGDSIWQLTWQEGVAIKWDRATLRETDRVRYTGEGWGLCHDGNRLIMSDGSDRLTFRNPDTFARTGEVAVTRDGSPLDQINELECVRGHVWANVWGTDEIVRIDPGSGRVTATVDASGLLSPEEEASADVLNGIAAIPGTNEFLLTGKYWPHTYHVRFR